MSPSARCPRCGGKASPGLFHGYATVTCWDGCRGKPRTFLEDDRGGKRESSFAFAVKAEMRRIHEGRAVGRHLVLPHHLRRTRSWHRRLDEGIRRLELLVGARANVIDRHAEPVASADEFPFTIELIQFVPGAPAISDYEARILRGLLVEHGVIIETGETVAASWRRTPKGNIHPRAKLWRLGYDARGRSAARSPQAGMPTYAKFSVVEALPTLRRSRRRKPLEWWQDGLMGTPDRRPPPGTAPSKLRFWGSQRWIIGERERSLAGMGA